MIGTGSTDLRVHEHCSCCQGMQHSKLLCSMMLFVGEPRGSTCKNECFLGKHRQHPLSCHVNVCRDGRQLHSRWTVSAAVHNCKRDAISFYAEYKRCRSYAERLEFVALIIEDLVVQTVCLYVLICSHLGNTENGVRVQADMPLHTKAVVLRSSTG